MFRCTGLSQRFFVALKRVGHFCQSVHVKDMKCAAFALNYSSSSQLTEDSRYGLARRAGAARYIALRRQRVHKVLASLFIRVREADHFEINSLDSFERA